MDNNKKHSYLRIVWALFIGMAFCCLLDVIDSNFRTHLYDNYHTIVCILLPVILVGCLVTHFWSSIKKKVNLKV